MTANNPLDAMAAQFELSAQEVANYHAALADQLAAAGAIVNEAREDLRLEREARATADRHREMFRHALWRYLQERDGAAGSGAPTPETLQLIRDVISELEHA